MHTTVINGVFHPAYITVTFMLLVGLIGYRRVVIFPTLLPPPTASFDIFHPGREM
ncbi:hypothetical protein [Corynebacterium aquilae]|uniref:hypothetical protein n=1 Tax=Corynebacterium aquilae TaxID=203263 RepID=UPI0012ED010F|nr:hypothetical protein [Corynebacterium aquilae]